MVGQPKRVLKASRLQGLRGPVAPQVLCAHVCMCECAHTRVSLWGVLLCICQVCAHLCACMHLTRACVGVWVAAWPHAVALRIKKREEILSLPCLPHTRHGSGSLLHGQQAWGSLNGAETCPSRTPCKPPCVQEPRPRCVMGAGQAAPSLLSPLHPGPGTMWEFSGQSHPSSGSSHNTFPRKSPLAGLLTRGQSRGHPREGHRRTACQREAGWGGGSWHPRSVPAGPVWPWEMSGSHSESQLPHLIRGAARSSQPFQSHTPVMACEGTPCGPCLGPTPAVDAVPPPAEP